jgi:hypothetical protein
VTPTVVCLCGSTRFRHAIAQAAMEESFAGRIVVGPVIFGHDDYPQGSRFLTGDGDESLRAKQLLDELHYRKIDLADEILVVNVGGYVGSSTAREIAYAEGAGKRVRYTVPEALAEVRAA